MNNYNVIIHMYVNALFALYITFLSLSIAAWMSVLPSWNSKMDILVL